MFRAGTLRTRITTCTPGITAAFLIVKLLSAPCLAQGVDVQGDNYGNVCSGHAVCIIGPPPPYVQFVRDIRASQERDGTSIVGIVVQIVSPYPPNNMVVGLLKDPNLVGDMNSDSGEPVLYVGPAQTGATLGTVGQNEKAFVSRIQTPAGAYVIQIHVRDPNIKPKIIIGLNVP